jgi:hypothetical protein
MHNVYPSGARSAGRARAALLALAGLCLALACQPAAAQITGQLTMQSDPGDYIGQGQQYQYTSESALFSAQAYDRTGDGQGDYVTLAVRMPDYSHWWYLTFATNKLGTNLVPGVYTDAQRAPFAGDGHPGLDVFGDGRGCNTLTGSFTVDEAVFATSGGTLRLVRFAASFEQHCEGFAPALRGTIDYTDASDLTPPVTTIEVSGPPGGGGWLLGPAQVTLSATDTGGSGVAATYARIDGGATQTYSGPFIVSGDGVHAVEYWSVDSAGNPEARRSQSVKIDATAPVVSLATSMEVVRTGSSSTATVTVSARITDTASGVDLGDATFAVADEYGQLEPSGPVTLQPDGSATFTLILDGPRSNDKDGRAYQITVRGRDQAGNAGASTTGVVVPRR